MHILAVLPPDRWMEINLLDSLREHYCEELHVFHYPGGMGQLGSALWRTKRDELNNALLTTARRLRAIGRLDLIFCVVYDDFLLVETAEQLQQLGVPMVNYHVDMAFQWYRAIRTAPYFDVLAVAQLTNAEHLRPYCQDIHWMPMAANPTFYYRPVMQPMTPDHSVTFVGSFNPFRRALLQECVRHGIRPVVFGRGWQLENPSPYEFHWDVHKVIHDLRYYAGARWKAEGYRSVVEPLRRRFARRYSFQELSDADLRGPCEDERLPDIFHKTQVNLGFSDTGWHSGTEVRGSKNLQCRLRDFEVPMAGGLYLVQEAPDHPQYYKIGEEIVTWSDPGDFVEKVRFYARHENAASKIRDAGQRRALQEHTWRHRFDQLFDRIRCLRKLG
jgi:spore maturation protein CgeB